MFMQIDPADGPMNIENVTPPLKTEKTAYSRLRVLTAPPTSIHEMGNHPFFQKFSQHKLIIFNFQFTQRILDPHVM
jgi:hypothetical protein